MRRPLSWEMRSSAVQGIFCPQWARGCEWAKNSSKIHRPGLYFGQLCTFNVTTIFLDMKGSTSMETILKTPQPFNKSHGESFIGQPIRKER